MHFKHQLAALRRAHGKGKRLAAQSIIFELEAINLAIAKLDSYWPSADFLFLDQRHAARERCVARVDPDFLDGQTRRKGEQITARASPRPILAECQRVDSIVHPATSRATQTVTPRTETGADL